MKTRRKVHLKFNPSFAIQYPDGTVFVNVSDKFFDDFVPGVNIYYPDGTRRFIANSWYVDIDIDAI